ncbi:hypothetical protein [Rivihabitans pingtungensis]|uniref:hypothetical protein n=1 Tax=Rivihabitans pingtungensis TaxID=1054498 RepID=UPI002897CDFE|nr:hypothetical protein [Rivihabitans pingtungensis]
MFEAAAWRAKCAAIFKAALIESKNHVCQQQNPAKSKGWIPACAGMTIFSACASRRA